MTQDLGETYLGHSFILTAHIRLNIVTTQDMREANLGHSYVLTACIRLNIVTIRDMREIYLGHSPHQSKKPRHSLLKGIQFVSSWH